MTADAIVKRCACSRTFTAAQWAELSPPPGEPPANDALFSGLDLRNCPAPCGSTLALIIIEPANDDDDAPPDTERSPMLPGYDSDTFARETGEVLPVQVERARKDGRR